MTDLIRKFVRIESGGELGDRQIRIIASDATVDRVNDVMVPEGCDLTDYKANPIILAQHDPKCPIGKSAVDIAGGKVVATIDFAPAGISPKADEYCGLAKAGIINAASVGFEGVEWEPIKGGGKRYTKWKLMEISLVSVPANPSALVIARSIEQAPSTPKNVKSQFKVGASRNLPVDQDSSWNSTEAGNSIFDHCGFDGDNPDIALARKGFLSYDAANPTLKESYRLPIAKVAGGRLTAVADGVRFAASQLDQAGITDDVKEKARAVIDHYEGKMKTKARSFKVKGLYECAELAYALMNLGWIHDMSKWEAEAEADGSKLPAMLAQLLVEGAAALNAMTAEETAELLAGRGIEAMPEDSVYVEAAATPEAKAIRATFRKAGRVLSQANRDHLDGIAKCLKSIMDCATKAADLHDDLHDQVSQMMDHGTSMGEHVKCMTKNADGDDNDEGDDDNRKPEGDDSGDDGELAFAIDHRKRALALLDKSI